MKLIETQRKSRVLTKAQFGCLKDAYTLNVTRGCEFLCVYCYAWGYPEAPDAGEVFLYRNLPEKLAAELDNPRRRTEIDRVIFNTASDSFQRHPAILDTTFETMKVLLERGIGFSFLTKGWIPDRFVRLFSRYADRVHATIGLCAMSSHYQKLFEPHAASIYQRLHNIDRLQQAGVETAVRIDPIIPFYTDDEASIIRLYTTLAKRNIRSVALSYLHMRPAILNQLENELPPTAYKLLSSCFDNKPWKVVGGAGRSRLIPLSLRKKGYRRFMELSKSFNLRPVLCSCKNPDMPAHICPTGMIKRKPPDAPRRAKQLSLFSC